MRCAIALLLLTACAATRTASSTADIEPVRVPITDPRVADFARATANDPALAEIFEGSDIEKVIANKGLPVVTRVNPRGFEGCLSSSPPTAELRLRYDVMLDGRTENIEVIESNDSCFDLASRRAVAGWRYVPPVIDGTPVVIEGVETSISFTMRR